MPLGDIKYLPRETSVRFRAEPYGHDTGQALETPLPLYELTQPFSYTHMTKNWDDIIAQ